MYPVGRHYIINTKGQDGNACEIVFKYHEEKENNIEEYLVRTGRKNLSEAELSFIHRTLIIIEASFEWLKSNLGSRPIFTKKTAVKLPIHWLVFLHTVLFFRY